MGMNSTNQRPRIHEALSLVFPLLILTITTLLLCFPMTVVTDGSVFYAVMRRCEDNSSVLHFREGELMQLCCYKTNTSDCSESLQISHMRNHPSDPADRHQNASSGPSCSVALSVPDSRKADSGEYLCSSDGKNLYVQSVYIIEKPILPNVTTVQCCSKNTMTVNFDRGLPHPDYHDSYRVKVKWRSHEITLCENITTMTCEDRLCRCRGQFAERGPSLHPTSRQVTVELTTIRSVQNISHSQVFDSLIYTYQPEAVKDLSVDSISPWEANLSFGLTDVMKDSYVYPLSNSDPALWFKVMVQTEHDDYGGLKQLSFAIPVQVSFEDTVSRTLKRVTFTLTQLVPHTQYNVKVIAAARGGDSPPENVSLWTNSVAPLHSPIVDQFAVSAYPHASVMDNSVRPPLVLYWQPLQPEARGGVALFYHIQCLDIHGNTVVEADTNGSRVVLASLPRQLHLVVSIWAVNEIGRCDKPTVVEIPPQLPSVPDSTGRSPYPRSVVEFSESGDSALIFVDLRGVQVFIKRQALLWCTLQELHASIPQCVDYPASEILDLPEDTRCFNHSLSLQPAPAPQPNQTGVFSQHSGKAQLTEDPGMLPVFYTYVDGDTDAETSEKRRVPVLRSLLSARDPDMTVPQDEWMVMVSVMYQGRWSASIPAQCYFHRSADNAKLTIEERHVSGQRVFEIDQICISDVPQFLTVQLEVWSSPNKDCSTGGSHPVVLDKPVLEPLVIPKPVERGVFFCIRAVGSPGESKQLQRSEPFSRFLGADPSGDSSLLLPVLAILVFSILSLACILLAAWFSYRQCVSRGKKLKTMLYGGSDSQDNLGSPVLPERRVRKVSCPQPAIPLRSEDERYSRLLDKHNGMEPDSGHATGSSGTGHYDAVSSSFSELPPDSSDKTDQSSTSGLAQNAAVIAGTEDETFPLRSMDKTENSDSPPISLKSPHRKTTDNQQAKIFQDMGLEFSYS